MNEVPLGWTTTRLGDLGDVRLGKMLDKAKNQGLPTQYLRNINVRWFRFDLTDLQMLLVSEDERELLSVQDGDLFICEGGEPCRCAVWRNGTNSLVYQKALHRFRTSGAIVPELLMYRLRHDVDSGALQDAFTGTTIKHLTRESLSRYEIPLPPINEQKRIVHKLNAVLARVDACRKRLVRVPAILKRFRQAALAAATSGKLTEEWRKERYRSLETWSTKTGREVFPFITSGSRGWAAYYSASGARFLRVGDLDHDTIELNLQDVQYVMPPQGAEGQRTRIQVGDILISITADVGMVGLVRADLGESYINQHLCLARQAGEYSGSYLAYFLASPTGGLVQLTEAQRGATKAGLTLGDIRELQIQVPQRDEQDEIVRRVEILFAYANRFEARYTAVRAQVERLTPTLLAKAFRGELVPQDPNDEPASVLLERLRATREAAGKKSSRKVRTERKPVTTKLTIDALKKIIRDLPSDRFTLDDLRGQVSADQETLEDVVCKLMSEAPASVKQVFDAESQTIQMVRVKR